MSERLGRYQLLHRIAFGGMAEIWLARQDGAEGFEKLVVIKRILANLAASKEFLVMFFDEARLAARLSHPNICQIYDLGSGEGSYYIAMEYVHGENLRAVTRRTLERNGTPLPPAIIARVISDTCQGLHYAHTRTDLKGEPLNVVHRDVSPQNVLLGYDGQVKIVDFGIAKAASQLHETRAGVIKGKYAYMSPEQCTGSALDRRSDLFSLGVVLWELLTGRRLFLRDNELKTMNAICDEPPPPPSAVRPEVPADLDRIALKALAKTATDRYQSGEEMHRDLELFLRSQPDLVTASTIATEMESLFDDRLAAWREVFVRSSETLDPGALDEHPELFEVGTPSVDPIEPMTPAEPKPKPKGPAPKLEVLADEPSTTVFVDEVLGEADRVEARGPLHGKPGDATAPVPRRPAKAPVSPPPTGTEAAAPDSREAPDPAPAPAAPAAAGPLEEVKTAVGGVRLSPPQRRGAGRGRRLAIAAVGVGALALGGFALLHLGPSVTSVPAPNKPAKPAAAGAPAAPPKAPVAPPPAAPASSDSPSAPSPTGHEAATRPQPKPKATTRPHRSAHRQPRPRKRKVRVAHRRPVVPAVHTPRVARAAHSDHGAHPSRLAPATHRAAHGFGYLSLNAVPWCKVTLDGHVLGMTPIAHRRLPAGPHELVCVHPKLGRRILEIRIPADKVFRKMINLGAAGP